MPGTILQLTHEALVLAWPLPPPCVARNLQIEINHTAGATVPIDLNRQEPTR